MKNIAVAAPIDLLNPTQSFEGDYLETVRTIGHANPDLHFSIIDVYTLSANGQVQVTNPVTMETEIRSILDFDLLHFLELERDLDRDITFREKWAEVYNMLDILAQFPIKCVNSIDAIRYCSDKSYLLDLKAANIPIIETNLINSTVQLQDLKEQFRNNRSVVKPIRGECGRHVFMLNSIKKGDFQQLSRQDDIFLLQPFHSEIMDGEISLLFFDDVLSHAVYRESCFPVSKKEEQVFPSKRTIRSHTPTNEELAFGRNVYNAFKEKLNIYRVDFLATASGFVLMEVESVDPYHYARFSPDYGMQIGNFYRKHLS
jgi:glutathione synthase/RimK-type ligase-like ATP-grasp enzyme